METARRALVVGALALAVLAAGCGRRTTGEDGGSTPRDAGSTDTDGGGTATCVGDDDCGGGTCVDSNGDGVSGCTTSCPGVASGAVVCADPGPCGVGNACRPTGSWFCWSLTGGSDRRCRCDRVSEETCAIGDEDCDGRTEEGLSCADAGP